MTLKELATFQEGFDSRHEGYFRWNSKITNDNIGILEFLVVSLAGEVGETANIVKKIARGDCLLDEKKNDLQEEIADIFIYLLKMSYQMDIDLEEAYLYKMKKNQERFQKYEKRPEKVTSL